MKKKIRHGLHSELTLEKRKERIESILNHFNKSAVEINASDFDYSSSKSRMQLTASIILWCSILGTLFVGLSSLYYMSVPEPTAYVTTQDGRLVELKPFKKER